MTKYKSIVFDIPQNTVFLGVEDNVSLDPWLKARTVRSNNDLHAVLILVRDELDRPMR